MTFLNRINSTDNEAIYELRDELRDLNKTIKQANVVSEKLTWLLSIIGVLQLAVMSFQLAGVDRMWLGLGFEIISVTAVVLIFRFVIKKDKKLEKEYE